MKPKRRIEREKWWAVFNSLGEIAYWSVWHEKEGAIIRFMQRHGGRWEDWQEYRGYSVRPVIVEYEIPAKGKEK